MAQNSYYWNGVDISEDQWEIWMRFLFTKNVDDEGVIIRYSNQLQVSRISDYRYSVGEGAAIIDGTYYENTSPILINIPDVEFEGPPTSFIFFVVLIKNSTTKNVRVEKIGPYTTDPTLIGATNFTIPLAKIEFFKTGQITLTDRRNFCTFSGLFPDEV